MNRIGQLGSLVAIWLGASLTSSAAATVDLGNGFADHGVATAVAQGRGTVATIDAQGRDVVLVWLMDHRGGYELLLIDASTGRTEQFPLPFEPRASDAPFASLLSSKNRYYTHFHDHFIEFDVAKRAFTFVHATTPQMAMGMTEDDRGVIWAVTYPRSGVVSYDPKTGAFRDYGAVYDQNWAQYPRFVAADDEGWIYFGLGNAASQIIALDPVTGRAQPMLAKSERKRDIAYVYRDLDGRVYGQAMPEGPWIEFHGGQAHAAEHHDTIRPRPTVTGTQALFQTDFPDGKKIEVCDLTERRLVVRDPRTKTAQEVHFDYATDGAIVLNAAAAPDGTICGGTTFPMRFFSYDPRTDRWVNRAAFRQWNAVARFQNKFYVAGYIDGFLLEWDGTRPWVATQKDQPGCNPLYLTDGAPLINRPDRVLPWPDGKTVIIAGTPEYGYTGGGLLFWDTATHSRQLLDDREVIPDQSTCSLLALPGGKLLGGTATSPGTGGEKKAATAELYLMDLATRKLDWHQAVLPGAQEFTDLCHAPDGLVYGLADGKTFFVFDPAKRVVIHRTDFGTKFGQPFEQQGPKNFVTAPRGTIYLLLSEAILRVESHSFGLTPVAHPPRPIAAGGDYLDGRIFFASGSHLCSFPAPP